MARSLSLCITSLRERLKQKTIHRQIEKAQYGAFFCGVSLKGKTVVSEIAFSQKITRPKNFSDGINL